VNGTAVPASAPYRSRRDRQRAATAAGITATARRLLVSEGPEGATLRAIARELGMTAPALYRYFRSHEELRAAVEEELFRELVGEIDAAWDALPEDSPERPRQVIRTFRAWALAHPREFELVFARSASRSVGPPGEHLGTYVLGLYRQWWARHPCPVRGDDALAPTLAAQLRPYQREHAPDLPLGALELFLTVWTRVYGLVALEVFEHLRFALDDAEPLIEAAMAELLRCEPARP
jgi:AcrR family transcriptional regulator